MKLLLPLLVLFTASSFAQMPPIEPGVSQELAIWRAAHYSDVRYKLNLTLEKMSPVLKGTIEIRVNLGTRTPSSATPAAAGDSVPIILDWRKLRGNEILSKISNVTVNGRTAVVSSPQAAIADGGVRVPFEESNDHLIFRDGVTIGENVIKLDFTSPILTSGSAITRYIDKEDGSEYIYSLFVPSDASTAFPVFDQPDMKARFSLTVGIPVKDNGGWRVISNSQAEKMSIGAGSNLHDPGYGFHAAQISTTFEETKPISTYVFAFAAGPFAEMSEPGAVATGDVSSAGAKSPLATASGSDAPPELRTHIYVRKSQAEKFKPHAAETFRLMREGVKYLEGYFDYKFPWPKYDLVLIPEFPFGGMEHAGATFVRESSIIFPTEPTKSDYINRATLIFHETAHQWFGDTVTMKWFDDLWLKEGFANFMAYKAMEKIMPETNAWKVFYERIKQPAYATDSTKGTTPIYQPIANLSAAKSAYGNIVYNKAPAFLRQAEFYLGEDKFQTAVRAFLKKHEYADATWEDLVKEFETATGQDLKEWANVWVKQRGLPKARLWFSNPGDGWKVFEVAQLPSSPEEKAAGWSNRMNAIVFEEWKTKGNVWEPRKKTVGFSTDQKRPVIFERGVYDDSFRSDAVFPNFEDYGYGIFLLDDKSRDYVLKNVQNEKDPFLRSMMYGALWDSVREGELDPKEYIELVIKNLRGTDAKARASARAVDDRETDETITQSLLSRASIALNYYIPAPDTALANARASAPRDLTMSLENVLIERMQNAPTLGQKITFYRAFLNIAASENARKVLKQILKGELGSTGGDATVKERASSIDRSARSLTVASLPVKTKDKFDIVTRLAILGDPDAEKLLAGLEKTETSDDAKRYAYAARAAFATKENREKFWNDFVNNKQISESWIEAAMWPFNSIRHDDLSLPYLERALKELPNLKRDRKIFFVNGWLGAFIGGQKSQQALDIVNKFLADNPNLDNDLRLKILENVDVIERAVKIRTKYAKN